MQIRKVMKWGILSVLISVFLYSSAYLAYYFYMNANLNNAEKRIQKIARIPMDSKTPLKIDWAALNQVNSDIVGWILIPDTNISLPIVQGENNAFYLDHSFEKKTHYAGAIFLSANAQKRFQDRNSIIYGHNVKTGAMFAQLSRFKQRQFFEDHPFIYIFTPEKNYRCKVVSFHIQKDLSSAYQSNFANDQEYLKYVDDMQRDSLFQREYQVTKETNMVMLSTCSYAGENYSDDRYVLHAALLPWEGVYLLDNES